MMQIFLFSLDCENAESIWIRLSVIHLYRFSLAKMVFMMLRGMSYLVLSTCLERKGLDLNTTKKLVL